MQPKIFILNKKITVSIKKVKKVKMSKLATSSETQEITTAEFDKSTQAYAITGQDNSSGMNLKSTKCTR